MDRLAEGQPYHWNVCREPAFEEAVRRRVMLGAEGLNSWAGLDPSYQADWEAIAQEVVRCRAGYTADDSPETMARVRERFGPK